MARFPSPMCMPPARCWAATTMRVRVVLGFPSSLAGSPAVSPRGRNKWHQPISPRCIQRRLSGAAIRLHWHKRCGMRAESRAELEKIVGPTAVDERPVRDLWPLAIMDERAGTVPPRALVVRPTGRDQVADVLRWATSKRVAVTPMGGGSGVCGALAPAAGPALHQVFLGAEGGLGVVIGAVLRVHRLPETTVGRGYAFGDLRAGLECMRSVMQAGIRPLVMRLYDAEDTLFSGYEVQEGECVLVIAAAGLAEVAAAE